MAKRIAMLLAVLWVASGCLFSRSQLNVVDLEERAKRVEFGTTTVDELEQILGGAANSVTPIGTDRLHVYAFGDTKTAGLSIIVLTISKTNSSFDTALFLVDENDIVQNMSISRNTPRVRWQWWAFGD